MNVDFTPEQFETLTKMVHLANFIASSSEQTETNTSFGEMEQYILSLTKSFGLEKYAEFDTNYNLFFPTRELEEDEIVEQYIGTYDEEIFWDELIHRLAHRDMVREYGEEELKNMEYKDILKKEQYFLKQYVDEFDENGIERIGVENKT